MKTYILVDAFDGSFRLDLHRVGTRKLARSMAAKRSKEFKDHSSLIEVLGNGERLHVRDYNGRQAERLRGAKQS